MEREIEKGRAIWMVVKHRGFRLGVGLVVVVLLEVLGPPTRYSESKRERLKIKDEGLDASQIL